MSTADRLRAIVDPLISARGLDLYDLEQASGHVTLLVDRDGGVDLEALAELTRAVSRALDEHDPVAGRYTLEVSSPGLERPLRRPEHFQGAIGTQVTVKTVPGTEGDRRIRGALSDVDDQGVSVTPDEGPPRRLRYADIERARTVFEWGPAQTSQKRKPQKKKKRAVKT